MKYENLLLEIDSGFCTITLNRPEKRNALDPKTWEEIQKAIRRCRSDKDVKAVIITGAGGKAFASGADIGALKERETLATLESISQDVLNEI
jgi:enoyl-CoA hydratase